MTDAILAIDQGTTGTTALLLDQNVGVYATVTRPGSFAVGDAVELI